MLKLGDKVRAVKDHAPYFYIGDVGVVVAEKTSVQGCQVSFNKQNNLTVYKIGVWFANECYFEVTK